MNKISKNILNSLQNENLIIHISGTIASGKSTLGNMLKNRFHDKIYVYDLDDILENYNSVNTVDYNFQMYLDYFISIHLDKPLILTGFNTLISNNTIVKNIFYNLYSNYNFYIKTNVNTIIYRYKRELNLGNLEKEKKWFFGNYNNNLDDALEKMFKFIKINEWKQFNNICDKFYEDKEYIVLEYDELYKCVSDIIEWRLKFYSG